MKRITLAGTHLAVSRICLGGNRLGADLDQDASFALLDTFVEQGGNFIDTAHVYADWLPDVEHSCSEKTLGRWCKARGADVVIATKIGHPRLNDLAQKRLDRASLRQDVVEACENLQTDCLDLVYLHRDDPTRDVADIVATMEELRRDGKIGHYAASNWSGRRMAEATGVARDQGWQGFAANQAEWSFARRNAGSAASDLCAMDADMIAWHRDTGAAAIPYSAQARGYFDKRANGRLDARTAANYDSAENQARGDRLAMLAERHGVTPTQAMLALFGLAPFPVIPVVGCHSAAQIAASFAGISLDLGEDGRSFVADLGL